MAEIVDEKVDVKEDADDKTMCRHGFHDWVAKDDKRLDPKTQKMRSVFKCAHCGKERLDDK